MTPGNFQLAPRIPRNNPTPNLSLQIIYKLEYNKAKPKGYTTIQDTPMLLHVRKVKDRISDVSESSPGSRNTQNSLFNLIASVCNCCVTLSVKIITLLDLIGL